MEIDLRTVAIKPVRQTFDHIARRFGDKPAAWIHTLASQRSDLQFELIDLRSHPLPFFDEALPLTWAPAKNAAAQAPDLEAARVGEDGPLPADEAVQAAELADHVQAGAQEQVEGVAEDDLRADGLDVARQHALDRTVSTDRHERWGFNHTTGEGQTTATSLAISGQQLEGHTTVAHA